jgi:hypothetical protein
MGGAVTYQAKFILLRGEMAGEVILASEHHLCTKAGFACLSIGDNEALEGFRKPKRFKACRVFHGGLRLNFGILQRYLRERRATQNCGPSRDKNVQSAISHRSLSSPILPRRSRVKELYYPFSRTGYTFFAAVKEYRSHSP